MGVRFEWANSDHVLMCCYIEQPWTWEEYQVLLDSMVAEVRQQPHPVATLVEVTRMKTFPKSGNVMQNLQRIDNLIPDNVFASVIVGAPHVASTFLNVLMQIRPKAKRITIFANSIEEAYQILAQRFDQLYPEKRSENKFSLKSHK